MLVFKAWRKSPALTQETTPSQRRITRILSEAQQAAAAEFGRNLPAVAEALSRGQVDRVVAMLPTEPWLTAQEALAEELLGELLDAGSRVTLPSIEKARLDYSFDRERPESSQWARQAAGSLIAQITGDQRNVVRDVVAAAGLGEMDWGDVARQVQGSIGLTTQQAGWVSNHYDRAYGNAIRNGMSASRAAAAARSSADRYQTAIHRYRANTIARTETMSAASEGRMQAWNQGLAEGFISPDWQKEWVAEANACDICMGVNGKKIKIKESFSVGEPPAHPNCRCDVILVPSKSEPAGDSSLGRLGTLAVFFPEELLLPFFPNPAPAFEQIRQWQRAYEVAWNGGDRRTFTEWFNDVIEPDLTAYATFEPEDGGRPSPRATIDEIAERARKFQERFEEMTNNHDPATEGSIGDGLLGALYEELGYDALPTVLDEDSFLAMLRDSSFPLLWRGVSDYRYAAQGLTGVLEASAVAEMFRSGRYYPGLGIFGNGTYTATYVMESLRGYAGMDTSGLFRMVLKPWARVANIESEDFMDEYGIYMKGLDARIRDLQARHIDIDYDDDEYLDMRDLIENLTFARVLFSDRGRYAAARGYDALLMPNATGLGTPTQPQDYYIVLNRGSVYVAKEGRLGPYTAFLDDAIKAFDALPFEEQQKYWESTGATKYMLWAFDNGYDYMMMRDGSVQPLTQFGERSRR